jgi:hypothetical protein
MRRLMLAVTTLAVLLAGCASPSRFSAGMKSWSAFRVQDVSVADCTRAPAGYRPAPPAED